jgi:hypothetical protein
MLLSEICSLVSVGHSLWREDGSAICSVITQWSESLGTRNHTLLSHLRLPQSGGPGSRIYIHQEKDGPVIPPGTGFPWARFPYLYPPGRGWPSYTPGHWVPLGQIPVFISPRNKVAQLYPRALGHYIATNTCSFVLLQDRPNRERNVLYCCFGQLPMFATCGRFTWKILTCACPIFDVTIDCRDYA